MTQEIGTVNEKNSARLPPKMDVPINLLNEMPGTRVQKKVNIVLVIKKIMRMHAIL